MAACPACGGLLSLVPGTPPVGARALREMFDQRLSVATMTLDAPAASGVWRFRELVLPEFAPSEIVSQPEGNTPLLQRDAVAAWAGVHSLQLKHDGFNPTGSFKDRGMTVAMTHAKRIGARAVICASTGNTSSSAAAYAAIARVPCVVLVPEGNVASGKLAQTLAYGARTLLVRGDFDDCLRLARESTDRLGAYIVNSTNPFRIAGQRSCAFEVLQQSGWTAPDWIALPAGNLGNTSAIGAALLAAHSLGVIDRVPRILAVQAEGASPFAESYRRGFVTLEPVRAETRATAIRIGHPASFNRAARVIRETNGIVEAVTDDEILEAKAVIDASGVGCEPASAAGVAGVRRLVRAGVIRQSEHVVAVITGHVLKDPGILLEMHGTDGRALSIERANTPRVVDATLDAVERAMRVRV
jgi:threonine synthase